MGLLGEGNLSGIFPVVKKNPLAEPPPAVPCRGGTRIKTVLGSSPESPG